MPYFTSQHVPFKSVTLLSRYSISDDRLNPNTWANRSTSCKNHLERENQQWTSIWWTRAGKCVDATRKMLGYPPCGQNLRDPLKFSDGSPLFISESDSLKIGSQHAKSRGVLEALAMQGIKLLSYVGRLIEFAKRMKIIGLTIIYRCCCTKRERVQGCINDVYVQEYGFRWLLRY